jgi:peptidylprolyl isomerase
VTDDVQDRTIEDAPEPGPEPAGEEKTSPAPTKAVPVIRKPSPANLRRQAKKEAARRAAEARRRAKRRRQAFSLAGVAAAVVVLLVGGWLLLGGGDKKPAASASATPSTGISTPAGLTEKPAVTKGEGSVTELKVTPLVTGTGPKVESGQTITVNYVGVSYADGKEFDTSWGKQPYPTKIGVGAVIEGWDKGLVGQTVGSRVQLDIPESMAYPNGGGPSGALRFVVDILAVG